MAKVLSYTVLLFFLFIYTVVALFSFLYFIPSQIELSHLKEGEGTLLNPLYSSVFTMQMSPMSPYGLGLIIIITGLLLSFICSIIIYKKKIFLLDHIPLTIILVFLIFFNLFWLIIANLGTYALKDFINIDIHSLPYNNLLFKTLVSILFIVSFYLPFLLRSIYIKKTIESIPKT